MDEVTQKKGNISDVNFVSGDNAFTPSNSMITPANEPGLDYYNFEQSSLRMPIECTFGMVYRRFGLLWRPLSIRFDRRAAVIGAIFRLHNYCIDWRITEETQIVNGLGELQPGRWEMAPKFDRDGRPVVPLDTTRTRPPDQPRATATDARYHRRNELAAAITAVGLRRPQLSAGLHKKKRGRGPTISR